MTAGQSCGSTSRLLVHESIAESVVEGVVERMAEIRVGLPTADGTEMGCLITEAHRDRVVAHIDDAASEGASVLTGRAGEQPLGPTFVMPTVLSGVRPEMRVAREEIFGPVLSVITWSDEAELVALANATRFGLTASIWSGDLARAHSLAREIDAGYIWFNTSSRHFDGLPFGGFKDSGVGREECLEELLSYTQTKSVHIPLAQFGGGESTELHR
jgi:2-formylbenzoate dehydrogenase